MYCCRIVNGIKNKNIKKQPWSNVECFAFGGATVRFAALETSFHAANHTIPPPPSYEGSPHCPKDKNRSPFHGEKHNPVGTRYFESTEKVEKRDFRAVGNGILWLTPSCAHSLLRSFICLHGVNYNQPFPTATSLYKIFTSFTIFFQCFRYFVSAPND